MTGGDRIIRVSTAFVVVGIAGVAAYVSYRHALEVVRDHGETGATALLVPLTIDGLVYVASMVLLDAARRRRRAPGLARWTLALGIGATIAANVLHGLAHGPVGAVIAAWPAVTLVVVFELLMLLVRGGRVGTVAVDPATVHMEPVPTPVPATEVAVPDSQVPVPAVPVDPDPHQVAAASVFAEQIEAGDVPSIRKIRKALKIGQPRAQAVREYLAYLAVPVNE